MMEGNINDPFLSFSTVSEINYGKSTHLQVTKHVYFNFFLKSFNYKKISYIQTKKYRKITIY